MPITKSENHNLSLSGLFIQYCLFTCLEAVSSIHYQSTPNILLQTH